VSSDFPESSPVSCSWSGELHQREPGPPAREWIISALLFGLTFVTTSFAGLFYVAGDAIFLAPLRLLSNPGLMLRGLLFSVPVLAILTAHELGHFLACRYYGMRCTPPFFIPVPIPITGTLGAFIKIKSQFISKRALFDIGIAGPLAGFVFIIPTLWIGITLSEVVPKGRITQGLVFGEPLLLRLFGGIILGYSPETQDMFAHPFVMAAWFGLLATSLNLLPIWQLDGGHISYSVFGKSLQKRLSVIALVVLTAVCFSTVSYLLFCLLLLVLGLKFRFYHPPTLLEDDRLGLPRLLLAFVALVILIVSFIPVPVVVI